MEENREEFTGSEIMPVPKENAGVIPFRDSESLAKFMDQPLPTIAAAVTGALSLGYSDAILVGGRLVQATLKGKLLKQVAREINDFIEKGRIKEDYANSKYGFKSLVELLEFIDSEVPDEDRLQAVKAMFVAVNAVDAKEGEELVNYQLLQISKKLSGGQILVLKTTYDMEKEKAWPTYNMNAVNWLEVIASRLGHKLTALVEQDESALISSGLIANRIYPDRSGIQRNERLTDLGIRFCDVLVQYGGTVTDVSGNP